MCTVEGIKEFIRQNLKGGSKLSSDQMLLFVKTRIWACSPIQNDEEWISKINYGERNIIVRCSVFSHPLGSTLPSFNSVAQLPSVQITNTTGRELVKWYPDNSNCYIDGLKRFVECRIKFGDTDSTANFLQ